MNREHLEELREALESCWHTAYFDIDPERFEEQNHIIDFNRLGAMLDRANMIYAELHATMPNYAERVEAAERRQEEQQKAALEQSRRELAQRYAAREEQARNEPVYYQSSDGSEASLSMCAMLAGIVSI